MSEVRPRYTYYMDENPNTVLPQLKKWVDWHVRRKDVAYFYIGQTCNPEARIRQHKRKWTQRGADPYDSMDVIFGSKSYGDALRVERELIATVQQHPKYDAQGLNAEIGLYDGKSDYALYVLTDHSSASGKRGKAVNIQATEVMKPIRDNTGATLGLDGLEAGLIRKLESAIKDRPDRGEKLRFFYVGMTDNPDRRFKQHQEKMQENYGADVWDSMKILFTTSDLNRVTNMESRLIKFGLDTYKDRCFNKTGGRVLESGRLPYTYVYYAEEKTPEKYGLSPS